MIDRRRFIQYSGAMATALGVAGPSAGAGHRLPTRPIPSTGETLPVIGLGNSAAFREGDMALSRELLGILTDHGGSYVDTSGRARRTIAAIVADDGLQDELFVGTYIAARDYASGRLELEGLQEAQGGGSLDLVVTSDLDDLPRRWSFLEQYKQEGMARHVGVARSGQEHFETVMSLMEEESVDVIQINYSLLEPEAAERMLPMAKERGVAVVVNRPFVNGAWFDLVRNRDLPGWAADFDCESWAGFSLKFILGHPAVTCVLTETTDPAHARENVAAGLGRLPDQDLRDRMLEAARELTG